MNLRLAGSLFAKTKELKLDNVPSVTGRVMKITVLRDLFCVDR